jgi:trigger factor
MKNYKTFICLFLALAIPFLLLTGCVTSNDNPDEPTESTEPDNSQPPSDTTSPVDYDPSTFRDAIDENGFFKGVRALDHIEMFNYKAIVIPSEVHQVPEEDLQMQIDNIVSQFSSPDQILDRAVADGDTVNIDYVGSIDGVEFDGGNTNSMGTDVTIGVTEYIDDFLEQLIGHMPGETIDVEVTFPDSYPNNPDLEKKDALFVTTINYIADTESKAVLTDDFVMENLFGYYGWSTVQEMKDGLRADMRKYNMQQFIKDYFANEVTVLSMPDQLIKYQENSMLSYYQEYANYYGIGIEELLSSEGLSSVEELISTYHDTNMISATSLLVLLAVAEDAGFTVTDDDVAQYFQDNNMTGEYDSIVEQYGLPFIKHTVLCAKVIDYVIDNAILA